MNPHNHPIKTTLALTLALGAIAPAAAAARVDPGPPEIATAASPPPAVQVVRARAPGGFDWGDASIGAAGGFGLSMLAVGGGLVIAQRRGHHSSGPSVSRGELTNLGNSA